MLGSKSRTQKKKFLSNNSLPCWKSIRAEQQEESQVFSVILAGEQNILCSNRRDIIFSWVLFWQSPSLVTRALTFSLSVTQTVSKPKTLPVLHITKMNSKYMIFSWWIHHNRYRKHQTESYLQPHSGTFFALQRYNRSGSHATRCFLYF